MIDGFYPGNKKKTKMNAMRSCQIWQSNSLATLSLSITASYSSWISSEVSCWLSALVTTSSSSALALSSSAKWARLSWYSSWKTNHKFSSCDVSDKCGRTKGKNKQFSVYGHPLQLKVPSANLRENEKWENVKMVTARWKKIHMIHSNNCLLLD